jgi:myosin heavy subunit
MAKIIYARMFNWIISKVNHAIAGEKSHKDRNYNFIGLLDIFGFEIFDHNWFEQLCINYANEKLQQHFNNYMFQNEQQEYLKEGLNIDHIKFKDNKKCIDLIEKKSSMSPSIFSLLDDFSILNKNTSNKKSGNVQDELLEKFDWNLMNNEHYESLNGINSKKKGFVIHHFAGKVEYEIKNFLEKNKDSISPLIESVLANCSNSILANNFLDHINGGTEPEESKQLRGNSLAFQFKDQLNDLMKILNVSSPRYVRCIKPNGVMKPKFLESDDVRRQLIWAGVLEAIRIRQIGYPIRKSIKNFIRRYKPILSYKEMTMLNGADEKKFCKEILSKLKLKNDYSKWQIGNTKVFMKEEVRQHLESELGNALVEYAVIIQKGIRKHLFRRRMKRVLAWRAVTRSFHKLLNQNYLRNTYALKYWKPRNIIIRNLRRYLKNKNFAYQQRVQKEAEEKKEIDQKMKEMEMQRKKLEAEHNQYRAELERLESKNMDNPFSMNDSDMFVTPGGPDDEEYKYDKDAFKEDFDNLSMEIDNTEIAELQQQIENLETKVRL